MSDEKDNGKVILIATILCVVVGIGFVFRLDQKIMSLFDDDKVQKQDTPVINIVDSELQNLPKLQNMVTIYLNTFSVKEITIKEGEVINFYNASSNPAKVIGDGWQSAYIDKTGVFTNGSLKKGEHNVYVDGFPKSSVKIIVK